MVSVGPARKTSPSNKAAWIMLISLNHLMPLSTPLTTEPVASRVIPAINHN